MWKSLAKISLERENAVHIAIRAHAAIGDFAKVSICYRTRQFKGLDRCVED